MLGKKFSIFGDSISTFEGYIPRGWRNFYEGAECTATEVNTVEDTWWMKVIDYFQGKLLRNASYSGSMVEGQGFPAAYSWERICALSDGGRSSLEAITTTEDKGINIPEGLVIGEAPDVILIYIGINDYGWGSAAAEALGASAATPLEPARRLGNDVYGRLWRAAELPTDQERRKAEASFEREAAQAPNTRLDRFADAYDLMLKRMCAAYPQAEVWCCTLVPGRMQCAEKSTHTYQLRGIPFDSYNEAIQRAAKRNGAYLADLRAFGQDYLAYDGTHPTKYGMEQLASMVIAALSGETLPRNPLFASTDPCLRPDHNCEACEYITITRDRWSCVCGASVNPR